MGERGGHISEKLKGAGIWAATGVSSLLAGGVAIVVGITRVTVSGSVPTVLAFFLCGLLFLELLDGSLSVGAVLVLVGVLVGLAEFDACVFWGLGCLLWGLLLLE